MPTTERETDQAGKGMNGKGIHFKKDSGHWSSGDKRLQRGSGSGKNRTKVASAAK